MANSTEYRVRVVFQTALGNLEGSARRAVAGIRQIGTVGRTAGREGSTGFAQISESAEDAERQIQRTGSTAQRVGGVIKKALAGAAAAYVGKKIVDFGVGAAEEYGKTQKALGEMSSLGYKDLETLREAAVDFSNTWSGTTREEFISAAYDIKSGIASLSDEGVAKFTEMAGITAKATKSSVEQMTSLFAKAYAIYRGGFDSDNDFGEQFSASISKATQVFRTQGSEMESYLSSLGASAANAGVSLDEVVNIGGVLQTQAGTTGSEAATQYSSFLGNALRASKALGMSFTDNNGRLLPALDIIDKIHAKFGDTLEAEEKFQLKEAFGDDMSVDFIDNLYNKIGQARETQEQLNTAMAGGLETTKAMARFMNEGLLEKMTLIQQSWGNVLEEMGKQMEPGITPALDGIIEKLREMQDSGDFTKLGESMGQLIAAGAQLFSQLLDRAPAAISVLAAAFKWLADNIDTVVFVLKTVIPLWAGFKAASAITNIIGTVSAAFGRLTLSAASFRRIFTVLKNLLKTNIFGLIISAVISLIFWFTEATAGITSWKDKFKAALLDIQAKFFSFVKIVAGLAKTLLGILGKGFKKSMDNIVKDMDKKIADTQKKIDKLKDKEKDKGKDEDKDEDKKDEPKEPEQPQTPAQPQESLPFSSDGGGYSGGSTSTPKTIEDKISDIEDKYDDELENREIKADMATKQNQSKQAKTFKEQSIELLKKQVNDLLYLENNSSGNNRTVVENARLKLLQKIQEITEDIRGGINSMAGDFNTPSDIAAMNKYQYLTSKGSESGLYYSNGKVEMYFNIKNPDGLSTEQLKDYINEWAITGAMAVGNVDYNEAKKMADQFTRY